MDHSKSEYEFLDLSDINEEERCSLTSALFPAPRTPHWSGRTPDPRGAAQRDQPTWTEPHYDLSSCSSDTAGPPTASSSLDSLSEREMAPPHPPPAPSPPRGPQPSQQPAPTPPQHYSQPPPGQTQLYSSAPPPPWAPQLMPPNVYVSQVTANVNVHGYMSQYYQPHQHQYASHQPNEPRSREGRRGRRGGPNKRAPSPPQTPYIYYPQYYPSAQTAQGAPLYHLPVYPQMGYIPGYPYNPYVEYPILEDPNQGEKGPEEYPPEMMMEHEHMQHEVYYPHPCVPPPTIYDPNRPIDGACSMESYPPFFSMPPPHTPSTHQFNVHAKNFVRQSDHKNYNAPPQETKPQESVNASQPNNNNKNNTPSAVPESLPIKDLKINSNKPPTGSPKHIQEKPPVISQTQLPAKIPPNQPPTVPNDKVAPKLPAEIPKQAWSANNNTKNSETIQPKPAPPNAVYQPPPPTPQITAIASKPAVPTTTAIVPNKINKSPVPAPFTNIKTIVKNTQPPAGVIVPQQTLPAKAPFATKPKKEATIKPQETAPIPVENTEPVLPPPASVPAQPTPEVKPTIVAPTIKPNPPLAIAPAPIASKAPFSHARKPSITTEVPVSAPAPPPQAPTASDFPPPPAPRRVTVEQSPVTTQSQPAAYTPSPARSWASLFVNKNSISTTPSQPTEETTQQTSLVNQIAAPISNTPATLSTNTITNQKPVAKVLPFDSSPLQLESEKSPNSVSSPGISYSEKTSNGQLQKGSQSLKDESTSRECQQNQIPPHINDPNSYRMGEFLAKYQLSHHTVSLQPRGLSNRSNYCYINAILQALIACPPFYNMLRSLPHQARKGKSATPIIDAMVELIHEFSPLPPGARTTRAERNTRPESAPECGTVVGGAGPPLEPGPVLRALRDVQNGGDSFRVDGRQEDAEEFLGCLLNGLNDEMLELIKLVEPEESKDAPVVPNGNDAAQESDDDVEWKVMGPKNKGSVERRCSAGRTPLSDIFRGQLRSKLQRIPAPDSPQPEATHCVQPFFTLPLDTEFSNSVREALERVAGRERMEGVRCRERGRPVDAWSQSLLECLPPALLLHLKCFQCRPQDNATAKILKAFEYPVDLKIDPKIISPKIKYSTKQRSYKLFAVVYHEGSELEKGHYLADAYHAGTGGWLRYDDSIVTAVTEHQVLHPRSPRTPYLLLYRRQDTMQAARHPQNNN